MKLPRTYKRHIVRLLMVLALFAQWVVPSSVYAAMPMQMAPMTAHATMSCHSGGSQEACLTHCSQVHQFSLDHAQLAAAPVSEAVLHVSLPSIATLATGAVVPAVPQLAASPPLSILYCSLLN